MGSLDCGDDGAQSKGSIDVLNDWIYKPCLKILER